MVQKFMQGNLGLKGGCLIDWERKISRFDWISCLVIQCFRVIDLEIISGLVLRGDLCQGLNR